MTLVRHFKLRAVSGPMIKVVQSGPDQLDLLYLSLSYRLSLSHARSISFPCPDLQGFADGMSLFAHLGQRSFDTAALTIEISLSPFASF